jgi:hypothetical protein
MLTKSHNHHHFWTENNVVYESYNTLRGIGFREVMFLKSNYPDKEFLTQEEVDSINKIPAPEIPKVTLELTPFTELQILGFTEAMLIDFEKTEALQKSILEYRTELTNKITTEQLEDANAEIKINELMGKHP